MTTKRIDGVFKITSGKKKIKLYIQSNTTT